MESTSPSASTKTPNSHGSLYKEVRFSPTVTPIRRAKSASTSTPSASRFPRRSTVGESYSSLSTAYLQQSRELLERQRAGFENERALFAEERSLWEKERALMRLRIEELEWMVRVRSGVSWSMGDGQNKHSGQDSEAASKPTRVFLGTAEADGHNLGVVSALEQGGGNGGGGSPFSLDAALSPRSAPADAPGASVPVPIEKVDSTLDGITLKSTALPPDIVARVMTTPSPSLLQSDVSPSAPPPRRPSGERRSSLKLKLSDLKTPARNLTRDAGHTPMAVIADPDMGQASVGEGTPDQAPADTGSEVKSETAEPQRPRENSESYFPDAPDDDPALTGPLSLLNEEEHDQDFLKELNQKLLDSARQLVNTEPKGQPKEADAEPPSQGEPEPELKFKNTTNFGTAFGKSS